MSAIKAFFDNTFFMNGTEGILLFAVCTAAFVFTLVVIAMTIVVAVSVKRHGIGAVAPVQEVAIPAKEPVEEAAPDEEPVAALEEPTEETAEELSEEPTAEETEIEELTTQEIDDVASYEEEEKDEDGIEVIGVMFRRRGRKVYWFDPNGRTWKKGEIALYKSPIHPPQEVIVVDNARLSPSKLHLPLKPLCKASRGPLPRKK